MKLPKLENLGVRQQIMIAAMGVALAGMFISVMSWWFLSGLKDLESEVKPLERGIRDARKIMKSEEIITGDYAKIESMLGTSLSDAESISDMKEDIEGLASDAGLVCDPPSHREPVADASLPWREYTVQLAQCEGSMDALLAFISSVENSPLVYRVEKMTVSPAKTGTGINASIIISRIMLPPEIQPDDVAGEG